MSVFTRKRDRARREARRALENRLKDQWLAEHHLTLQVPVTYDRGLADEAVGGTR
jgi:hypothetical protein